jgi:hypothetical protein
MNPTYRSGIQAVCLGLSIETMSIKTKGLTNHDFQCSRT